MLEYLFASRQAVMILRLLVMRPWIFSLPEISQELKIPKNTVRRAIKPLVDYNIVREFRKGKGTVFQLNDHNYIVIRMLLPLFHEEFEYPMNKASELCRALKGVITAGMVFGSASKGAMTPTSDIDLALISSKPDVAERLAEQLKSRYLKKEGILFSIRIYRPKEFKDKYAVKDPLAIDIANGKSVFGNIEKVI